MGYGIGIDLLLTLVDRPPFHRSSEPSTMVPPDALENEIKRRACARHTTWCCEVLQIKLASM